MSNKFKDIGKAIRIVFLFALAIFIGILAMDFIIRGFSVLSFIRSNDVYYALLTSVITGIIIYLFIPSVRKRTR